MTAQRREKAAPAYPVTFEVLVCRDIYRILHEEIGPFYVDIPWASKISWPHKDNRRNFDIFCDFISGYAALRCMQRDTREGVVFANRDDFNDAVKLYRKLNKTQTTKLNPRQLLVVQTIFDHNRRASLNELTEILATQQFRLKYDTIRKILHGRDGGTGLLARVPGMTLIQGGTSTTTKYGDDTTTTSDRSGIYVLPDNFRMLDEYDIGSIELPAGAEDIDIATLELGHLGHRSDATWTNVLSNFENTKIPSKKESEDVIQSYTTTLHNKTHTRTCFPGLRQDSRVCEKNIEDDTENSRTREILSASSEKRPTVEVNVSTPENGDETKNGEPGEDIDSANTNVRDMSEACPTCPSGQDDVTFIKQIPARTFMATIGAFRYTIARQNGKWTYETLRERICRELADEHSRHINDVYADWDAAVNDSGVVGYIDEICEGST